LLLIIVTIFKVCCLNVAVNIWLCWTYIFDNHFMLWNIHKMWISELVLKGTIFKAWNFYDDIQSTWASTTDHICLVGTRTKQGSCRSDGAAVTILITLCLELWSQEMCDEFFVSLSSRISFHLQLVQKNMPFYSILNCCAYF
jgi:hypothetical protein